MRKTVLIMALLAALPVYAEGTNPRAKATEYPAHANIEKLAIGAEYLVHSFAGQDRTFVAKDYLVIEVALYPAAEIMAASSHFLLRINGRKQLLFPQAPGFVAASLKYPGWEYDRGAVAEAGAGDARVIIGRPETISRFPGDPRPQQTRLPKPPKAPEPDDRAGIDKREPVRAEDVAIETALPERAIRHPVSGYLYFAYKGKTQSIRSLDLLYQGPAGNVTLRLLGIFSSSENGICVALSTRPASECRQPSSIQR